MTTFTNNAEGTNGTAVTTGNSGTAPNTAWGTVNKVTGAGTPVINYSTAQSAHGTSSLLIQGPTTTDVAQVITPTSSTANGALRFYLRLNSLPSLAQDIGTIRNSAAVMAKIQLTATNKLRIADAGATTHDSVAALSAGTWYRVEVQLTPGASITTGRIQHAYYLLDNTSPIDTAWDSGTTLNLGTTNIDNYRFGKISNAAGTLDAWFDDFAWSNTSTTLLGPVPSPPTAAFTSSSTALLASVDGTGSVANGGATITGYDWDWGDATAHGTGSTATHTYASANTYTVVLTVTDSNGLTGFVSHSVTVSASSASASVASVSVSAGWTPSSGTVLSVLNDGDATTFNTSSAGPSNLEFTSVFTALIPPSVGDPLRVLVGIDRISSASGTFTASIIEGVTTRSTISGTAIPAGVGGSVATITTLSFPYSEVSVITDWTALKLKLLVTSS